MQRAPHELFEGVRAFGPNLDVVDAEHVDVGQRADCLGAQEASTTNEGLGDGASVAMLGEATISGLGVGVGFTRPAFGRGRTGPPPAPPASGRGDSWLSAGVA